MMLGFATWPFGMTETSAQTLYPTDTRKPVPPSRPKGTPQTVSVSPYARSHPAKPAHAGPASPRPASSSPSTQSAQYVPARPAQQPQHILTLPDKYRQKPQPQPTETKPIVTPPVVTTPTIAVAPAVMPATKLSRAPVPPALEKPLQGMSIADVIDSTIRNAPDMPQQTASAPPDKIKQAEPEKPALLSVSEPETAAADAPKASPHQPSKQDIAGLGGDKPRFYWPVRGNVVSTFGAKGSGRKNDGVNISAPKGTPVRAAATGLVVYSGKDLGGLGNLVLIRHSGGYHTAYAHVDNPLVQTGDKVKAGEAIANVGKTGNVTTPQLHFEIRQGKKPVNPSSYLPQA